MNEMEVVPVGEWRIGECSDDHVCGQSSFPFRAAGPSLATSSVGPVERQLQLEPQQEK